MKPQSAFVWRVRLSLLLLAFGSLLVEQQATIEAPAARDATVAGPAGPPGALTVNTPPVKRPDADRSSKRIQSGQRHLADARMKASVTPGGPQ